MAFVPEYEHDVFVSYAHVDDRPFLDAPGPERASGWVATLVRHLKNELAQKVGRDEAFAVWFDTYNLRGNHTLTDEIGARLQRSAIFVAILSSGYLASIWCRDEARVFSGHFAVAPHGRLFVVEKSPLDEEEEPPPELSGRRNYRFWYRDRAEKPRTLAMPLPHLDEVEYFRQVEDLARDIHSQLKAMRSGRLQRIPNLQRSPLSSQAVTPTKGGPVVLLAEATDDLEFRRLEVQRYLEQQGAVVLPGASYPMGRVDFEKALDVDLARSRIFVQLLGPVPGKRPRDVPEGYGWFQLELARRRGVPVLQWRSPELDLAGVEWPRHRELLELETVQATSLETFKAAVAAALAPPPARPEAPRGGGERPLLFLNTEARHRAIAAQIRAGIGDRAVWTEPLFEGPAAEVREDLEQNLVDCDAMVMVYADNPGWARAQLRTFHKLGPRREHPVRAIPVIDAPPEEKPELGFYLPEMVLINGRRGIDPEALNRLTESLRL